MTDAFERPDVGGVAWRDQADGRPPQVELAVPAAQRINDSTRRLMAVLRSSVPVRTVLFVLPPLVLPPLAFDLSFGATLVVALLLLWLAAAAAVLATVMFDGSDALALRSIDRRLQELGAPAAAAERDALMAIGAQLDGLSDRVDALAAVSAPRAAAAPTGDHRPQEHWSTPQGVGHYERYDHEVASGSPWSHPRWQP